jgi:hypothetical protein
MTGASSFSVAASRSSRLGRAGGQDRVAAGDQPLAGEVRGGDLGQVLLIEQGQLEGAIIGHQLLDGRGPQRGDPPVAVRPGGAVFQLVQRGDISTQSYGNSGLAIVVTGSWSQEDSDGQCCDAYGLGTIAHQRREPVAAQAVRSAVWLADGPG